MKIVIFFLFAVFILFAEDKAKKDVNYDDLFKQLDQVISSKKVDSGKEKFDKNSMSKREKYHKEFNKRAKAAYIQRAKEYENSVNKLLKEYKRKSIAYVSVKRYSRIGNKKIAYVSNDDLQIVLNQLKSYGQLLQGINNYKELLKNIKDHNIPTIKKILDRLEQAIMDIRNIGINGSILKKSATKNSLEKENYAISLDNKSHLDGAKVISISKTRVKLKAIY